MKRILKTIDEEKKIIQLTLTDERWYIKDDENGNSIYYPSSTYICDYYYKSPYLINWITKQGESEAERIKKLAGKRGSAVHQGTNDLLDGKEIPHNAIFKNPDTGEEKEVTPEEYEAILSFSEWWKANEVKVIAREFTIFNEEPRYAGTLDLLCKIKRPLTKKEIKEGKEPEWELWLIDLKTSQRIYTNHVIQVSSYKNALMEELLKADQEKREYLEITPKESADMKLGILQVGYNMNKNKYKLTEVEDKYSLFMHTYGIWEHEAGQKEPLQKDLPIKITLENEEKSDNGATEA